jgi:hypothetical protein
MSLTKSPTSFLFASDLQFILSKSFFLRIFNRLDENITSGMVQQIFESYLMVYSEESFQTEFHWLVMGVYRIEN